MAVTVPTGKGFCRDRILLEGAQAAMESCWKQTRIWLHQDGNGSICKGSHPSSYMNGGREGGQEGKPKKRDDLFSPYAVLRYNGEQLNRNW